MLFLSAAELSLGNSCDEDLIKQKVKIRDFQIIFNSIDYGSFYIKCKKLNLI